jgi:hypothetical protein
MSPIRAIERARYPKNWPAISERIRKERARGKCECTGQCGHDHRAELIAYAGEGNLRPDVDHARCIARNGLRHWLAESVVVLTTAHLDHQPENCDDANLLAMCQRCHLAYDADHHAETRAAARRAELAAQMAPLFPHLEGS